MLAPDHIQNSSHGEQSRLFAGIASMPCASNGTAASGGEVTGAYSVEESRGLVDIGFSSLSGTQVIETPPQAAEECINIHHWRT
jgi:hypothetical protein